ncbi:hypothetical protein [Hydrogenibacillus sp. N12]|uniref:hypothetical protein n=1 Tax=Hydrogenibacillus sp. N12 TaxID=2866627 RepID=UPI001C7D8848|nr:hypothetical protein [Hydrogenibacillus sp. N12]QZA32357.1 hypothetical protein K2M58_08475 [Hydrogenibacillus sp. N12]
MTEAQEPKREEGSRVRREKVRIQCNRCGEVYILRGRRNKSGEIETGFVQCICGNTDDFTITPLEPAVR